MLSVSENMKLMNLTKLINLTKAKKMLTQLALNSKLGMAGTPA